MGKWDPQFTSPRVELLQPGVSPADLHSGVQSTDEKVVLGCCDTIVKLWADSRTDIPRGRLEESFVATQAQRQPIGELSVETQVIRRRIEPRKEPARQEAIDDRPLATGSPLALVPIEAVGFPAETFTEIHRLPGGESIGGCSDCDSKGNNPCSVCEETGQIICSACKGQTRIACERCGGRGLLIYPSGSYACPACVRTGSLPCGACNANGRIRCARCSGNGYTTCGTCDGFGRVLNFHVLVSEVSTQRESIMHPSSAWPVDSAWLSHDMELVWSEDVDLNVSQGRIASFDADEYSPPVSPGMLDCIRDAINGALSIGATTRTQAATARAVRLHVQGCYLHRVEYSLDGKPAPDSVFIGGLSNHIDVGSLHESSKTSTAWAQRPLHGLLRAIGLVESSGPASSFKKRIKEKGGNVHLLDTNTVVADAAEGLGLTVDVTDIGYLVRGNANIPEFTFELTHDSKEGKLVVGFIGLLGTAYREHFVPAMLMGRHLTFGRIGLVVNQGTGALEFRLFDTRRYDDLNKDSYSVVLRYLLDTATPKIRSRIGR